MIPRGVEVFVGLEPIDLRWSFDRLSGVVAERIGREARSGALFVLFGKRRDAMKVSLLTNFPLSWKPVGRDAFPYSLPCLLLTRRALLTCLRPAPLPLRSAFSPFLFAPP